MIEVRAPGKLVLLGEFAVLDGAPAVVAAVDAGVSCRVALTGGRVEIDAFDERFVRPALEAAGAPPGEYAFRAYNTPETREKLGLGSSAAATVAAVLAAREIRLEGFDPEEVRRVAATVHAAVQGSGSGIDVAASALGGVLRFRAGHATPERTGDLWDRLAIVATGRAAATGPRVERYLAIRRREAFRDASAAIVESWRLDPVAAFADAARILRRLDAEAGIGWWTDAYGPILDHARAHRGAAKPSGAGGGDAVVAVFGDRDARDAFVATLPGSMGMNLPLALAGPAHRVQELE